MKLNKKKLIALGLSALMCVSPLSSVAFAEELSDGSEEVVIEDLVAEEEIAEELPAVEAETEDAGYGWVDKESYWMFVQPGDEYTKGEDGIVYRVPADKDPICIFYLYSPKAEEGKKWKSVSVTATKTGYKEASCTQEPGYTLVANLTVDKQPIDASLWVPTGNMKDHTWVEKERKILEYPDCKGEGKTGRAYVIRDCSVCGLHQEGEVVLPKLEHDWEKKDPKTVTEGTVTGTLHYATGFDGKDRVEENATQELKNTKLVDGEIVVIDDQQDAYYAVLVKTVCKRCGEEKDVYDIYEILAKTSYVEVVSDPKGIVTNLPYYYDSTNPAFKTENIELVNCNVAGSYKVTTYVNDQPVNERIITVPAHHMETRVQIEFDYKNSPEKLVTDGTEIANQFTVLYTKDGYSIRNNHCSDSFVYYEVVHCTAAGCPNKEKEPASKKFIVPTAKNIPANATYTVDEKTGKNLYTEHLGVGVVSRTPMPPKTPDGDHLLNVEARKTIDTFYNEGKNKAFTYGSLKALIATKKYTDVKIGAKGNEDEDHDYVMVEYYCNLCGKYHLDVKYLVPHEPRIPIEENRVEPTCYSKGSYDAVTYCDICGKELRRRPMEIPKVKHENQIKVYADNKVYDDIDNENGLTPKISFVGQVVVAENGAVRVAPNVYKDVVKGLKLTGKAYHPATTYVDKTYKTVNVETNHTFDGDAAYFGVAYGDFLVAQDYCVMARVYTDCGICNNHKLDLLNANVTIEVVDVSSNAYACYPGTITLKATYTEGAKTFTTEQTFPYFTSINDYQGRSDHKPGKAQVETIDGNKFTVTRCSVCGTILDQEAVEPEKTDLTASDVNVVLGQTVKALVGTNSTGELTYKVENEEIATVDSEGVIRGVNYGSTTVTVNLAAKDNFEAKEATFIVTVRPQPTVIWQLRDEGAGTMVVRWRTIEGVDGVAFAYATDADFSDAKYSAWEKGNTQRRYGLEAATYYVKARTYVIGEDGNRIYSTWCTPKSISLGRYLPAPASMFCNVKSNGSVEFTVSPSAKAEGYQISYDDGTKEIVPTSSSTTANFTRKLGKGSFVVKVRAFAYAEDGKYYSDWVPAGTVTIQ